VTLKDSEGRRMKPDWQWCKKDNVPMKEIGGNIWKDHDFITYECPVCHKRVSTMFAKQQYENYDRNNR